MEKSKTYYWAIFQGKEAVYEGSFSECWSEFVERYAPMTVASLQEQGIRIARMS